MFPCSARGARAITVAALALAVAPASALAQSSAAPLVGTAQPNQIPGQYIVVLKNGRGAANADRVERRARDRGARVNRQYRRVLNGFAAQLTDSALADVRNDADVAYVEADQVVTASVAQSPATWGLDRIDQQSLPLNNTYNYNATGAGVKAYIIDTGIRFTHSQFGGRASSGVDEIDGGSADDCNGHGTHVSGTVGGSTYGVAKAVSLVAVRVLDCNGSGSTSGVIAGINWVTSDHQAGQPAVANMSLGGGASASLDQAVANSVADGVTYAVAAGNDNTNACNQSPARAPSALTVGSTTSTDARSSFSNYGTCVDIFAPGSSITSSWNTNDTATNTISGTSMATPHVAGVAALYLEGTPGALPATVNAAVVSAATPNKVTSPGTGSPNRLLYSLFGVVPPGDTTPPDTTITSGPADSSVTTDATPTFGFTSSETGSTFECQDDNGAWAACVSPSDRGPFSNASHTFRVRAKDASGNVDTTPAQRTFTVNAAAPTVPCGLATGYSGTLSGTGASVYLPSTTGYTSLVSGTHRSCLTGPAAADFDLYLFKRTSSGSWSQVARSIGTTSTESITYNGTAGTYRVQVISYRGSGAYSAGITRP
jgi:subtilisin family serine protease